MLSSHLPDWQALLGQTLMLESAQAFLSVWWRQDATEQWMVWFMKKPPMSMN